MIISSLLRGRIFTRILIIFSISFIFSCTKNDLSPEGNVEAKAKENAISWLDNKATKSGPARIQRINAIKENLIPEKSTVEKLENGESLYIIPLKSSFKMNHNQDKDVDQYLLLFENSKGVYKGNVMQFNSAGSAHTILPAGTIGNVWDCNDVKVNGSFTLLTIFDNLLYEKTFEGGRQVRYAEARSGQNRNGTPEVAVQSTCTDWYLVITEFYSDGSTYTTETYLGTTCFDPLCQPSGVCNEGLPPGDGGGGGPDPDPEVQVSTNHTWLVYTDSVLVDWKVYSTDKFKAIKKASLPNGGHFTSIQHISTEGPTTVFSNFAWKVYQVSWELTNNGQGAEILVQGFKVVLGLPDRPIEEEGKFTYSILFP
ncbi:MAG: hypothetical protein DI535_20125 [Citrobacter freundii]|nr:MAG: hypothetical protein DI535_20125 [Citrobacter freundii]